eukprot:scaffold515_cov137-Skeletonema_marinoi.AAC.11
MGKRSGHLVRSGPLTLPPHALLLLYNPSGHLVLLVLNNSVSSYCDAAAASFGLHGNLCKKQEIGDR